MRPYFAERIFSGLIVAYLVYSRVLSLTPGTSLGLSTTKRLYAPSNVRLEEFPIPSEPDPVFMVFVDHSVPWMIVSGLVGIAWIGYWTFRHRFRGVDTKKDFLNDEFGSNNAYPDNKTKEA